MNGLPAPVALKPDELLGMLIMISKITTRLYRSSSVACLLLASCASTTLSRNQLLAETGIKHAEAMVALVDESAKLGVEADTAILLQNRPGLLAATPSAEEIAQARAGNPDFKTDEQAIAKIREKKLREYLAAQTDPVKRRVATLKDIQKHSKLLQAYFKALLAMATTDQPAELGKATTKITGELASIHEKVRKVEVSNKVSVGAFVGTLTELAAAHHVSQVLQAELAKNGKTIRRELALQTAVAKAIREQMKDDAFVLSRAQANLEVSIPYSAAGALSKDWASSRSKSLLTAASVAAADQAVTTSEELQEAFDGLMKDDISAAEISLILADVSKLLASLEKLTP